MPSGQAKCADSFLDDSVAPAPTAGTLDSWDSYCTGPALHTTPAEPNVSSTSLVVLKLCIFCFQTAATDIMAIVSAGAWAELTAQVTALQQEVDTLKTAGNPMTNADLDTLWLMLCAIVVFFMQTGFTMLECGSCRAKNVVNIVFKNSMDACCAALSWWAIGWALAYGGDTVSGGRYVGF